MRLRFPALAIVVAAVLTPLVGAAVSPPRAEAAAQIVRLAGIDRYATSAAISRATYPSGVPLVMIAAGRRFPDALAAAPAARRLGATLLLSQRSSIPDSVIDEIQRLRPARVTILGGTAAIAESVETQVSALTPGAVDRISGDDRFQTAAATSKAAFSPGVPVAFVVSGLDFPDAIVAGAAGAGQGGPVLLTAPDALSAAAASELERLAPRRIVVVGGPLAVTNAVAIELEKFGPVTRVFGDDRYATGAALAAHLFPSGADAAFVASGDTFPDALSGGPVAGFLPAPLLLVPSDTATTTAATPSSVSSEIARLRPSRLTVLGGVAAVSEKVASDLAEAASEGAPAPPDLIVDVLQPSATSAVAGSTVRVRNQVTNNGPGGAPGSVVGFRLSADEAPSDDDVVLDATRPVPALEAGTSSVDDTDVGIPTTTPSGTYRLLGCADAPGAIAESDELHNCRASVGTIAVVANGPGGGGTGEGPNLVVAVVSDPPATAARGGDFNVTDQTDNRGTARAQGSVTGFILSSNESASSDDVRLFGARNIGDVGPNSRGSGATVVTVPAGTPPGTYRLIACADIDAAVNETDETDNCKAATASITIT